MKKWFLCIGLALFIGAFVGCKKEESPTETDVPKLFIMGEIERYLYEGGDHPVFCCNENVYVSNTEAVPSVKINDQELELYYYLSGFYFDGDSSLTPGAEYELVVTAGSDTAIATIILPEDFSITTPDTSYVLPKGISLNASWDSVSYADYYKVYLYVHYDYYDTSGNGKYFGFSSDTIISETSITYESSLLWPNLSKIDSVYNGSGYVFVCAINGPSFVPDTPGNVSGDGIGFFWATQEKRRYFDVGNAKKTSKEDRAKRHKEALKEQDKLWKQWIESLKEGLEL